MSICFVSCLTTENTLHVWQGCLLASSKQSEWQEAVTPCLLADATVVFRAKTSRRTLIHLFCNSIMCSNECCYNDCYGVVIVFVCGPSRVCPPPCIEFMAAQNPLFLSYYAGHSLPSFVWLSNQAQAQEMFIRPSPSPQNATLLPKHRPSRVPFVRDDGRSKAFQAPANGTQRAQEKKKAPKNEARTEKKGSKKSKIAKQTTATGSRKDPHTWRREIVSQSPLKFRIIKIDAHSSGRHGCSGIRATNSLPSRFPPCFTSFFWGVLSLFLSPLCFALRSIEELIILRDVGRSSYWAGS